MKDNLPSYLETGTCRACEQLGPVNRFWRFRLYLYYHATGNPYTTYRGRWLPLVGFYPTTTVRWLTSDANQASLYPELWESYGADNLSCNLTLSLPLQPRLLRFYKQCLRICNPFGSQIHPEPAIAILFMEPCSWPLAQLLEIILRPCLP